MYQAMKRFKLHQGMEESFLISRENFEVKTRLEEPYVSRGKDGEKQFFAVCPACENPIQLIGIYKELKNTDQPYGKHYGKSTDLADYNHQNYLFCPYSSQSRYVTKDSKKREVTDYEQRIYDAVRDNFDLAIYIIEQDTGIHITKNMAARILHEYIASRGYMYYWATLYNIPWMLLYFTRPFPCFGRIIKKDAALWEFFDKRKDVDLKPSGNNLIVKNKEKFLNLKFSTILHKRNVIDDEVVETIRFQIFSKQNEKITTEYDHTLTINEVRFPHLVEKAKYRNKELLQLAKEIMPEKAPGSAIES